MRLGALCLGLTLRTNVQSTSPRLVPIFLRHHLPAQAEPDDGDRQCLEGIRADKAVAEGRDDKVTVCHRSEDEDIDHQRHGPRSPLPRCRRVPQHHTRDGDDIGTVLAACGEEHDKHQNRGQQRLAESQALPLTDAQIRQEEQDHGGDEDPQVTVGLTARDTPHHAKHGDVLLDTLKVLAVLLHERRHPGMILREDILRTADDHRSSYEDDGPQQEVEDELPLVLREEEERQTHDAIELHYSAENNEERRPPVFLFLDEEERGNDDRSNSRIELLHHHRIEQLMAREPIDEDLLIMGHPTVPYGEPQA